MNQLHSRWHNQIKVHTVYGISTRNVWSQADLNRLLIYAVVIQDENTHHKFLVLEKLLSTLQKHKMIDNKFWLTPSVSLSFICLLRVFFVTICVASKPKHVCCGYSESLKANPEKQRLHLQTSESLFAFFLAPLGESLDKLFSGLLLPLSTELGHKLELGLQ